MSVEDFLLLVAGIIVAALVVFCISMIVFGPAFEQQYVCSKWEGRAFITELNSHSGQDTSIYNGYVVDFRLINGHTGQSLVGEDVFIKLRVGEQVNVTCQKGIVGLYDVHFLV